MISAFVLIQARPDAISGLASTIANLKGVREAHSVAGGEADLVAVLAVANHEGVARVVTDGIAKLDGVISTRTLIAFRSFSQEEYAAAFDGFGD
ncbi:MAG: Lrp/AsnC ligand binding domain-containing protein [Acidimicrobiales bacterium]|nr:Lrp/AsnC ligand binding domain-containing protein [Acidimicrobiales bacterium]